MKIKEGFVKRIVMDKTVIVPTGEAGKTIKGMIKLNNTASLIWDSIEEGLTEEETAKKICEKYDITEEKALADVQKIVQQMKDVGVFTE